MRSADDDNTQCRVKDLSDDLKSQIKGINTFLSAFGCFGFVLLVGLLLRETPCACCLLQKSESSCCIYLITHLTQWFGS